MSIGSFGPTALLLAAVLVPALLVLAWPWRALRPVGVRLAPWAAAPALALALLHVANPGARPSLQVPTLVTGLHLGLDAIGGAFLLFTALLWLVAGAFARSYHARDPRREAFFGFFTLTMTGNLGLVLAQDLVSFYLFFALMTFSAYGLVVHVRGGEALRAGRVYIVMAIGGELALLAGVLALGGASGGTVGFGPELEAAWARLLGDPAAPGIADIPGTPVTPPFTGLLASPGFLAALLVLGFGVKAGVVPLHLWLPLAHPVAPTAASALLSGTMIKAGLLGWLRVLPMEVAIPALGGGLVLAGVVTAFYGVLVGLAQSDAKTVLAYSSVSQMGYMAIGTGIVLVEPALAPVAVTAVVLYAVHHGIAKGALFLSVGVADHLPRGEGGPSASRWRRALLLCTLLPALALAGMPLTVGAVAKAVLKGAVTELEAVWAAGIDPLLLVAAGGTTLLMARFLVTLEARARGSEGTERTARAPWGLVVPWGVLLAAVASAPFWAVQAFPAPEEVGIPSLLYGILPALLPVAVGAAVAGWVLVRPDALGRAKGIRVPPGDLLGLVEAPLLRSSLPHQERLRGRVMQRIEAIGNLPAWTLDRIDRVARGDLRSIRGPMLGLLLFGLALALTLALAL